MAMRGRCAGGWSTACTAEVDVGVVAHELEDVDQRGLVRVDAVGDPRAAEQIEEQRPMRSMSATWSMAVGGSASGIDGYLAVPGSG
jgi:hypothetical protein